QCVSRFSLAPLFSLSLCFSLSLFFVLCSAQTVNLNLTVSQVEELRREREERRVSFSASLVTRSSGEHFGPLSKPTTLIYRHVITNTGNAYNPNTGMTVKTAQI